MEYIDVFKYCIIISKTYADKIFIHVYTIHKVTAMVQTLCIEKMIDLQFCLSRQFEMCSDLEEKVKIHKNCETKMYHYSR